MEKTNVSNDFEVNYDPKTEESLEFEIWIGLLSVALIFGMIGNVFAIISIAIAKFRKKFHFHKGWHSSTIYFLNLLAVDLLYSLFLMAKHAHAMAVFLNNTDLNARSSKENNKYDMVCRFFILGTQTIGNIGGWSVMSIVFTQAIPMIR